MNFEHAQYTVRRKVLQVLGASFHVRDPNDQVVMFSKMKAFKLKEDIRIYDGEAMENELLTIQARQVLDVSASYDVTDAQSGEKVGVLKRQGLKSILKDWLDSHPGCRHAFCVEQPKCDTPLSANQARRHLARTLSCSKWNVIAGTCFAIHFARIALQAELISE